ncbi:hypothetical protein DFH09DRAFT_1078089 [Mycena vulgaris]|nr:hypothetical protein DFH09DRAFT_1078089 [Mycena vulgaris]
MALSIVGRSLERPADFLANAVYGIHCAPTRDRSLWNGALFTFKDILDEDLPTELVRGGLRPFVAQIFGRVEMVKPLQVGGVGILVQLVCPPNITCQAVLLYNKQLKFLSHALTDSLDNNTCGVVASSWLSSTRSSEPLPFVEGGFYISIPTSADWMLGSVKKWVKLGTNVGLYVGLKHVDIVDSRSGATEHNYTMTACEWGRLDDIDLPRKSEAYVCDVNGSIGYSVAFVNYLVDMVPTRDRSIAGGSLYTFKIPSPEYGSEVGPTHARRGYIRNYKGDVFGKVDAVCEMVHQKGVSLRIKCPSFASCAVREVFLAQVKLFRNILQHDNETLGGGVRGSWFSSTSMGCNQELIPDSFHEYSLLGHSITVLDREDVPSRGVDYERPHSDHTLPLFYCFGLFSLRPWTRPMRYSLSGMRPPLKLKTYDIEFAASCIGSTADRKGSVYAYSPMDDTGISQYSPEHRPILTGKKMVFSGCVTSIAVEVSRWQSALVAVDLRATQLDYLREIAEADGGRAVWSSLSSSGIYQHRKGRLVLVGGLSDIRIGVDLIISTLMRRTDCAVEGGISYVDRPATLVPPNPTRLNNIYLFMLDAVSIDQGDRPDEPSALANSVLYEDFAPTRDATSAGISSFSYKDCHWEWDGTETEKGRLMLYCPALYARQLRTLESILYADMQELVTLPIDDESEWDFGEHLVRGSTVDIPANIRFYHTALRRKIGHEG